MIIHNSKIISPVHKVKLRWNEVFVLQYNPSADTSSKLFSISMTEQDKTDAKIVGSDRTFSVDQFDSAKIYNLTIDFKKTYKEKTEARVAIKLQYIKDYKALITKALCNLRNEKKSLYVLYKLATERINTLKITPHFDMKVTQNGGWYQSDNESLRKSKTHQRNAEIDLISDSFIDIENRRMS